jgi:hypothetical protein
MSGRVWKGSCHCGDIRFEVTGEVEGVLDCNCTICTKKGFLHWIVEPSRFRMLSGSPATYSFGTHVAKHTFCARCGVHPFYTPRSHPDHVDVNVRCLDGVDVAAIPRTPFDGRSDWEGSRARLDAPATTGPLRGACACGAIEFTVREIDPVGLSCYCSICRAVAGAPFASVVLAPEGALTVERGESDLARWQSSPGFSRAHCRLCHAPIVAMFDSGTGPLFVSAGALEPAALAAVVFDHIFVRSLVPWHRIADGRPRFETFRDGGAEVITAGAGAARTPTPR